MVLFAGEWNRRALRLIRLRDKETKGAFLGDRQLTGGMQSSAEGENRIQRKSTERDIGGDQEREEQKQSNICLTSATVTAYFDVCL